MHRPKNMQNKKIIRLTAPKFGKIFLKITLPAMAAVWLACYVGTGIFACYIHSSELEALNSSNLMYAYMLDRQTSRYSTSLNGEEGSESVPFECYRNAVQFYLRYNGTPTILCNASEENTTLIDSSEEKLFTHISGADGVASGFLSCYDEMDPEFHRFLEEYKNSSGKYHLILSQMYVNRDTWEFIPKTMYLSHSPDLSDTGGSVAVYETTVTPGAGFELLSISDENVQNHWHKPYLVGTWRNTKCEDGQLQAWYEAAVPALEDLQKNYNYEISAMTSTTYAHHQYFGFGRRYDLTNFARDTRITITIPVALYNADGSLRMYAMTQEHQYNLWKQYGSNVLWHWLGVTAAALGACTLIAYFRYSNLKSRWSQESFRRKLTNTMAHDLKSPLMAISGYAENIKENVCPEKRDYYNEEILKCVDYMNGIVADMLDLERLEQTTVPLNTTSSAEEVDVEALLRKLAANYQELIRRKKILFSLEGKHTLTGDSKMLLRAFDNLFSNAVNYTPKGNEIRVVLTADCLTMTNTGVSMSREMCRKAFEPFVKEDKARGNQRGSGLGLSIAKQIFDAHGMSCEIRSDEHSVSVIVGWKGM